ncbi:MAG: hypothetical protein RR412_05260, partial [Burkholderiaceae bacterium]
MAFEHRINPRPARAQENSVNSNGSRFKNLLEFFKMNKSLILASMMVVALAACGKKEAAPAPAPA